MLQYIHDSFYSKDFEFLFFFILFVNSPLIESIEDVEQIVMYLFAILLRLNEKLFVQVSETEMLVKIEWIKLLMLITHMGIHGENTQIQLEDLQILK